MNGKTVKSIIARELQNKMFTTNFTIPPEMKLTLNEEEQKTILNNLFVSRFSEAIEDKLGIWTISSLSPDIVHSSSLVILSPQDCKEIIERITAQLRILETEKREQ